MLGKIILIFALAVSLFAVVASAQEKTIVNDRQARAMLVGRHRLSLQWVSWDYFGAANVFGANGIYRLKGEQKQRGGTDFVKIDGVITAINTKSFSFNGKVTTQVSHINGGAPCERSGEMTFRITGKRRYWRLQEMDNPCDGVTDYVDVYFK